MAGISRIPQPMAASPPTLQRSAREDPARARPRTPAATPGSLADESGQDTVEYALAAAMVGTAAVFVLQAIAPSVTRLYLLVRFALMERGVGWW
jgi:Flp pilus assembly pilin Flp